MTSADKSLTVAIISYRKNRHNHRLLFGAPEMRVRRGWRREIAGFLPGSLFAYERWRGDKYGTQDWRIFICKASVQGRVTAIPGIEPGAILLASAVGKTRVKRLLSAMDELKKTTETDLQNVSEARWRLVGNAIETGDTLTFGEAHYA